MKLLFFGTGYVGLVSSVCFASKGHDVCSVDIDSKIVDSLNKGIPTIYEEGLQELLSSCLSDNKIRFSTQPLDEINSYDAIFICVGTPPREDGSSDLSSLFSVVDTVSLSLDHKTPLIIKSTVPVGTCKNVKKYIKENTNCKDPTIVSCPEFLREGVAISDFLFPDRVIAGFEATYVEDILKELFSSFDIDPKRLLFMDPESSELTKYASNSFLATKITFMNELARFAEDNFCDIDQVKEGMGLDRRIGLDFLNSGCGYGGSCFPKDIDSLLHQSNDSLDLLRTVQQINHEQKTYLLKRNENLFNEAKKVALWGLSFKANTDDVRESPVIEMVNWLTGKDLDINLYDPEATSNFSKLFSGSTNLRFFSTKEECLSDADILIIGTDWKEFIDFDYKKLKKLSNKEIPVIDTRNALNPKKFIEDKLNLISLGKKLK